MGDHIKTCVVLICVLLVPFAMAWAQTGTIAGKVTDEDGNPLAGANVEIVGTSMGAATSNDGTYLISNVAAGSYTLKTTYLGFEEMTMEVKVAAGETATVDFALAETTLYGETVVVTASRRPEKITEAPATISVISARDLDNYPAFGAGDLLARLKGVDFVRSGVNGVGINARGFNNAFNTRMLALTDSRNSMLAGGSGIPVGIMDPTIKEDIERVEVVLGPASALYGANAHNGIVNTITKNPRQYPGTTFVVGGTGGTNSSNAVSGRFRHAGAIEKFAYKATFEYTQGQDYTFYDSVYVFSGAPFFRPSLPEKDPDFDFKHLRGTASLYYTILDQSDIILSYGYSRNSFFGITNAGRNQVKDWEFQYLHLRYVSPRLFAQVYNTWIDAGKTFNIATRTAFFDLNKNILGQDDATADAGALAAATFIDKSRRLNAELQYNNTFGGFYTVVGVNYQHDHVNSEGNYLLDAEGPIKLDHYGLSAQIEKDLPSDFKVVLAGRLDHIERFDEQFSPKVGLLWNHANGTWRITYGRAYVAPAIIFQDAFIFGGIIVGNGRGLTVQDAEGNTREIDRLETEVVNTVEVGYKGLPSRNLYFDVNAYFSVFKNFVSPAIPVNGLVTKIGDDVLA
ncbi:MAG: carboxypeptidase regulatory-like domain-containing protein, partial [bacterium]